MTTVSHAFFSDAAPRSTRASCSGVKPLSFLGANLSIIPIQAVVCDVTLDGGGQLPRHRATRGDLASQGAARDVRRAPEALDEPFRRKPKCRDLRRSRWLGARPAEDDERRK